MSDYTFITNLIQNKMKSVNRLTYSAGGIQKDLTCGKDIHGHRTSKAPHPVRSAQLTGVPPSQYHGGGPHGNPGCCGFAPLFLPGAGGSPRRFWAEYRCPGGGSAIQFSSTKSNTGVATGVSTNVLVPRRDVTEHFLFVLLPPKSNTVVQTE